MKVWGLTRWFYRFSSFFFYTETTVLLRKWTTNSIWLDYCRQNEITFCSYSLYSRLFLILLLFPILFTRVYERSSRCGYILRIWCYADVTCPFSITQYTRQLQFLLNVFISIEIKLIIIVIYWWMDEWDLWSFIMQDVQDVIKVSERPQNTN